MDSLAEDMKKKATIAANHDNETKDNDNKADKGNKEEEGEESAFPIVADEWCANCEKEPGGEGSGCPSIILKRCSACKLVKYCSVDCQRKHFKVHKAECQALKEAREDGLFDEPAEGLIEDCNICFLPLQPKANYTTYHPCCGKSVCAGCYWGHKMAISEENLMISEIARRDGNPDPTFREFTCAYCRSIPVEENSEIINKLMARIEKYDDPKALHMIGLEYARSEGEFGLPYDGEKALDFLTRAAELGENNVGTLKEKRESFNVI